MTLKSERTKKCRLSSVIKENVPEPLSEVLEVLKSVANVSRRMLERNLGTRISTLGELKCFKSKKNSWKCSKKGQ